MMWTITSVDKKLSGISGPQDSAKGLANPVDIFEQFFDKDIVQKIVTVVMLSSSKIQWGNIFSKQWRGSEWQSLTAEEIYVVLALFMLMSI